MNPERRLIDMVKEIPEKLEAELLTVSELKQLEELRIAYLGKKGQLTRVLRHLGELGPEDRRLLGKQANVVKEKIKVLIDERYRELKGKETAEQIKAEAIDITLPGTPLPKGRKHPITQVLDEIKSIFISMGYKVATGPEVETEYNNFDALNMFRDHPARDMQDTFYISDNLLLRTHTSPVQIRAMLSQPPPIAIIAPGKVYRPDIDISHSPMFHQVEGLLVDKNVTFGDLKGTLAIFARSMFGPDTETRFRPSYFPFTEPSAEVDIQCIMCHGKGCRLCGETGWIEVVGSGMVHPQVLENVNYDPEVYTGFAFGMGVDRLAIIKYGINDIRLFFENDLRFLRQF